MCCVVSKCRWFRSRPAGAPALPPAPAPGSAALDWGPNAPAGSTFAARPRINNMQRRGAHRRAMAPVHATLMQVIFIALAMCAPARGRVTRRGDSEQGEQAMFPLPAPSHAVLRFRSAASPAGLRASLMELARPAGRRSLHPNSALYTPNLLVQKNDLKYRACLGLRIEAVYPTLCGPHRPCADVRRRRAAWIADAETPPLALQCPLRPAGRARWLAPARARGRCECVRASRAPCVASATMLLDLHQIASQPERPSHRCSCGTPAAG